MKKSLLAAVCSLLLLPSSAFAAVVLNEIAWMGSAASSADEWVELYNTGTGVQDLTGWKITGKGGAVIALLSGSIAPSGYFLIERSDDNTVPNIPADLVVSFGKGIANDGETLKLIDGGGTTVDTVEGGKNWSKLGGDKVSKQTAQRTLSGWITAVATPKAANKLPALASEIAPVSTTQKTPVAQKTPYPKTQTKTPVVQTESALSASAIASSTVAANVLWQRGRDAKAEKRAWEWMVFAILLVIAASVIIMRANVEEPTEADKYAIIEDIIESKDDLDHRDRLGDY